jgi:hypothetical protein
MIVRPNPIADDRITVSWEEGLAGNLRLELFDLAGRRLAKWSADPFIEREWSVHLSTALAPGIYLLRINRSDEMESRRLVVTR